MKSSNIMKNLAILGVVALTGLPMPSNAMAQQYATEWSDRPLGAVYNTPDGGKIRISSGPGIRQRMQEVETHLAQYGPYAPPSQVQYHPPSFFQGAGGPVVVPPTVINTQPNRCRQKRINLFLFFDVESSDC